jgi:hypothetical protein
MTEQQDRRLTELHDKLEANGFQRSKLSKSDQAELLELEQIWTDATAYLFQTLTPQNT